MAHLVVFRSTLCCLLTSVAFAVRSSHIDFGDAQPAELPNVDRVSCIRQDNLDLVVPSSPEYVMRQIVGVGGASTTKDIMVVATGIQLDFSAQLEIFRADATHLHFKLTGNHDYEGHSDVIALDFALDGLEIITQSTVMDWAASLVTNREALSGHQTGKLFFKMSGEAQALWSEEANEWQVQLSEQKVEPFAVSITSQYILTEALQRAGGIDAIIAKELWPMIQQTIPPSLGTAFNYVPKEDLWYNLKGTLQGSMASVNSPLTLKMTLDAEGEVTPQKVIQVFLELFDLKAMAEQRVDALLGSRRLRALWLENKEAFLETLTHYGLVFPADFLANAKALEDLEALRPQLMQAAQKAADGLVHVLQPFVAALARGASGFFRGFECNNLLKVGWGEDGKIVGSSSTPRGSSVALPAAFLAALGFDETLQPPQEDSTALLLRGLKGKGATFSMAEAVMEQVLLPVGNGSQEVWRLDGGLGAFELRLPASPSSLSFTAEELGLKLDSEGTLYLEMGTGINFEVEEEEEEEKQAAGATRTGAAERADGRLPPEFLRPTQKFPALHRSDLAPSFKVESSVKVANKGVGAGGAAKLSLGMEVKMEAEVLVAKALPYALAPRPSEDFGYVFFAGRFEWQRVAGAEAQAVEGKVVAVVSCGYLRVFDNKQLSAEGRERGRIDFTPTETGGQLEVDLSRYENNLIVGENCVDLVQSGVEARQSGSRLSWSGSKTIHDKLCGSEEEVLKLVEAINLQVQRFQDSRAKAWNYGTHAADEAMYALQANHFTKPLLSVLREVMGGASLIQRSPSSDVPAAALEVGAAEDPEVESPKAKAGSPKAGKRKKTYEREMCRVTQEFSALYFPPDPNKELPLVCKALPNLPGIGDLHLELEDLSVTWLAFKFIAGRKDAKTFTFEITNTEENGKQGILNAYAKGMQIVTPTSMVDGLVSGIASIEHGISQLNPFNNKENYGLLDRGPLDVLFHVKGDFTLDDDGNWVVVEASVIHDVKIRFGSGGALQGIINAGINGAGGIDKIFFESVWPSVKQIIPADLGAAFRKVPAASGSIRYETVVDARCPGTEDTPKRQCGSRTLEVKTDGKFVTHGASDIILSSYMESLERSGKDVPRFLESVVTSQRSTSVFAKSSYRSTFDLSLDREQGLSLDLSMVGALPASLLTIFAGPGIFDFVPQGKSVVVDGGIELKEGVLRVPSIRIEKLSLPVVKAKNEAASALQVDLSLRGFTARRVAAARSENRLDLFSAPFPIALRAQELHVQLDQSSGLEVAYNKGVEGKGALTAKPALVAEALSVDKRAPPMSLRSNASERADGALPPEFQRPMARLPGVLEPKEILLKADSSISVELSASSGTEDEVVSLEVKESSKFLISLSTDVLRGALDSSFQDYGYAFASAPGWYGANKEVMPEAALAVLSCGTLDIYKVTKKSRPYSLKILSIDLLDDERSWEPEAMKAVSGALCLPVKAGGGAFGIKFGGQQFFCAAEQDAARLRRAVLLQKRRFDSVPEVAAEFPGSEVAQAALPDGTWFVELDPFKPSTFFPNRPYPSEDGVRPPHKIWEDAKLLLLGLIPY